MKLISIETTILAFPILKPITTNILTFDRVDCIYLSLKTSRGLIGTTVFRSLGFLPCNEIIHKIHEIEALLKENNQVISSINWNFFWHSYRPNKTKIEIFALAAIDIAIWDLLAKEQRQPLHQFLGCSRINEIPAYGTTGWLSLTIDGLIAECQKYKLLGIKGFKIRLGHKNDYDRVQAVRKAMGSDYPLMLDANQQYNLFTAIDIAKKMAELDIQWFEEPIKYCSAELIRLNKESPIPIAMGENIFDAVNFKKLCEINAIDILQPDILRCGGITGFMKIAKIIESYQLLLCNHLLPELSASIINVFSNSYMLEYDDLLPIDVFTHKCNIKNGYLHPPTISGTGIELTDYAISHYKVN